MSATNRVRVLSEPLPPPPGCQYPEGTTLRAVTRTKRRKGDFYETPSWAVDSILPWLPLDTASLVIDAGAGTGAIAARVAARFPNLEILGLEKQPELVDQARERQLFAAEFQVADFETWQSDRASADIIVMNPPFSRALEFIRRAMAIIKRGGTVCSLLPLSFLAGVSRWDFHEKHPSDAFVLTKRPSFTGDGRTDAQSYAWLVWGPTSSGTWRPLKPPTKRKPKRTV